LIEIYKNYTIDKKWLKCYLEQFYTLLSRTRYKKVDENQILKIIDSTPSTSSQAYSAENLAVDNLFEDLLQIKRQSLVEQQENEINNGESETRLTRKNQEVIFKKLETELFELFESSPQAYWLNLILIENCRDYPANKYNSIACLIAKSFEKWTSTKKNSQHKDISDEIKIHAFITTTRHNLLMIDSIVKSYELWQNNQILEPYLKRKVKLLDSKDKAILISSVMMHDYFDFEEVN